MSRGSRAYRLWGFESAREYGAALKNLPGILRDRSFSPLMPADAEHESGAAMKRVLGWFDLCCFGIGMMLGAGVFVTTGYVAAEVAGPGVIISYVAAGVSALLSSFVYSEFAVDIPAAGGAYTYVAAALGEFIAWLTVANLIFEYILANAAAVRGFAPYFATLTNRPETFYLHKVAPSTPGGLSLELDWWAFGWCVLLSGLLVLGTRESARFNNVLTVLHVALVLFIIVAGFAKAKPSNAQPFLPFGARGAFSGAAVVFFSYIGFDTIATAAEETRDPRRDLPLGILSAVACVTALYTLMAAALVTMVPGDVLRTMAKASFAAAFNHAGWHWATYIVAIGALMGIVTSTLIGMFGASRIITGVSRDHLLPPFLARVGRFKTPATAIVVQGLVTGVLALLSPFEELADMVSISTLSAFWIVALAMMWRRSCTNGAGAVAASRAAAAASAATKDGDAGAVGGDAVVAGATASASASASSPPTAAKAAGAAAGVPLRHRLLVAALLAAMNAGAAVFTIGWRVTEPGSAAELAALIAGAALFVAAVGAFRYLARPTYTPTRYTAPLYPYLPSLSMALNVFLLGQLKGLAYARWGLWTAACVLGYLLYGGASSWNKAARDASALPLQVPATTLSPSFISPGAFEVDDQAKPAEAK